MVNAKHKRISHRVSHRHNTKSRTAGVSVKTSMDLDIVFTKKDLPLLRKTVRILEGKK